MQTAKNAAAAAKEAAANVAASANSGMEKTKAITQEKAEMMTAHDPIQKGMATEKKEQRLHQAEWEKQRAREQNAAQRQAAAAPGTLSYSTTGAHGQSTGTHQMSALPGHDTGVPTGQMTEGVVGSHPIGTDTGTGTGTTLAGHNTKAGGGTTGTAYGTGGGYR